jgi:hypothetical protein
MRRRRLGPAAVLAAASLGVAGCLMQANYSANVTTADGVQIEVPLSREAVVVSDGVVSIDRFLFPVVAMEGGKGVAFGFEVHFKEGARPVAISIDDVSDQPIMSVYTNNAPVLGKGNTWHALSAPHNASDVLIKWMMTLDNTVQVYRFTVKLADGTTHVLRYPIFAPAGMKTFMRTQIGSS